ncbi:MAG: DUF6600 domain-containing protein [Lentimicrobiaceae bacterium]|jgi:hypothetical protein
MKKITLILFLSMVMIFGAEAHKHNSRNAQHTISIQTFYDQLSPYGDWIFTPAYGYVWRPYFDNPESFRPYSSNGNWVYTDYGWTWASGYDWGWATFHYGRWDFDNYLGWLWIPGYEWAPAWVTWGSYDNYWGWAPLGPNIYVQYNSNWYAPDPWWTFVSRNHFSSDNWNHYIYNRPVNVTHITHITNVYVNSNNHSTNNSWYNGPRVSDVERYSKSKVRTLQVIDSQRAEKTAVRNDRLNLYRPTVDNTRKDARPTEYRNVEQARTGRRIEQTNARTNDPGVNRTRENRPATTTVIQKPVQRNDNSTRETKIVPIPSTQAPNTRTIENKRNSREIHPTIIQPETRSGSVNTDNRINSRSASQVSPEKNSTRPSVEPQRETPVRETKIKVTEGSRPITNTNRVVNTGNSQPRNNTPARENVNGNSNRETQQKRAPAVQPTREPKTQIATPASTTRTENAVRKQAPKEEIRQAESKKAAETPERKTSVTPTRR